MNPNNVIYLKCTEDQFCHLWIDFLVPFHKLTEREREVAARILQQYFRFKSNVEDPEILRELLWSHNSRKDIADSLKMSRPHFQLVLKKLKEAGFLIGGDINPKYIPSMKTDQSRFALQIIYDWSSAKNPVVSESQQAL